MKNFNFKIILTKAILRTQIIKTLNIIHTMYKYVMLVPHGFQT